MLVRFYKFFIPSLPLFRFAKRSHVDWVFFAVPMSAPGHFGCVFETTKKNPSSGKKERVNRKKASRKSFTVRWWGEKLISNSKINFEFRCICCSPTYYRKVIMFWHVEKTHSLWNYRTVLKQTIKLFFLCLSSSAMIFHSKCGLIIQAGTVEQFDFGKCELVTRRGTRQKISNEFHCMMLYNVLKYIYREGISFDWKIN